MNLSKFTLDSRQGIPNVGTPLIYMGNNTVSFPHNAVLKNVTLDGSKFKKSGTPSQGELYFDDKTKRLSYFYEGKWIPINTYDHTKIGSSSGKSLIHRDIGVTNPHYMLKGISGSNTIKVEDNNGTLVVKVNPDFMKLDNGSINFKDKRLTNISNPVDNKDVVNIQYLRDSEQTLTNKTIGMGGDLTMNGNKITDTLNVDDISVSNIKAYSDSLSFTAGDANYTIEDSKHNWNNSTMIVEDGKVNIKGNTVLEGDVTIKDVNRGIQFNLDNISDGETRSVSIPNFDGTLTMTDSEQTLTNKTIGMGGDLTMNGNKITDTLNVDDISVSNIVSDNTLSFTAGDANYTIEDSKHNWNNSTMIVEDGKFNVKGETVLEGDVTIRKVDDAVIKNLTFNLDSIADGETRSVSIPDADGTLVLADSEQTLTNKTIGMGGDLTMNGNKITDTLNVDDISVSNIVSDNFTIKNDTDTHYEVDSNGNHNWSDSSLTVNKNLVEAKKLSITGNVIQSGTTEITQLYENVVRGIRFNLDNISDNVTSSLIIPDANGTLILAETEQTLRNKTIEMGGNLTMNDHSIVDDLNVEGNTKLQSTEVNNLNVKGEYSAIEDTSYEITGSPSSIVASDNAIYAKIGTELISVGDTNTSIRDDAEDSIIFTVDNNLFSIEGADGYSYDGDEWIKTFEVQSDIVAVSVTTSTLYVATTDAMYKSSDWLESVYTQDDWTQIGPDISDITTIAVHDVAHIGVGNSVFKLNDEEWVKIKEFDDTVSEIVVQDGNLYVRVGTSLFEFSDEWQKVRTDVDITTIANSDKLHIGYSGGVSSVILDDINSYIDVGEMRSSEISSINPITIRTGDSSLSFNDDGSSGTKIESSGSLNIKDGITISDDNVTVNKDLIVNGTSTTINSINKTVKDSMMILNHEGTLDKPSGIVIDEYLLYDVEPNNVSTTLSPTEESLQANDLANEDLRTQISDKKILLYDSDGEKLDERDITEVTATSITYSGDLVEGIASISISLVGNVKASLLYRNDGEWTFSKYDETNPDEEAILQGVNVASVNITSDKKLLASHHSNHDDGGKVNYDVDAVNVANMTWNGDNDDKYFNINVDENRYSFSNTSLVVKNNAEAITESLQRVEIGGDVEINEGDVWSSVIANMKDSSNFNGLKVVVVNGESKIASFGTNTLEFYTIDGSGTHTWNTDSLVVNNESVRAKELEVTGATTLSSLDVSGVLKLEDKVSFVVDSTDEQEITLPDGGTLSTLDGIETLVNKTITMGGDLTMDGHNIVGPVSIDSDLNVSGDVAIGLESKFTIDKDNTNKSITFDLSGIENGEVFNFDPTKEGGDAMLDDLKVENLEVTGVRSSSWEQVDDNLTNITNMVIVDGVLHVSTDTNIYKLEDGTWVQVGDVIAVKMYNINNVLYVITSDELLSLNEGAWETINSTSELFTMIEINDILYISTSTSTTTLILDNGDVTSISNLVGTVEELIDVNGTLHARTSENVLRLNNNSWEIVSDTAMIATNMIMFGGDLHISTTDSVYKLNDETWDQVETNIIATGMITNSTTLYISTSTAVFKLDGDWVQVAEDISSEDMIIVNSVLHVSTNDAVFRLEDDKWVQIANEITSSTMIDFGDDIHVADSTGVNRELITFSDGNTLVNGYLTVSDEIRTDRIVAKTTDSVIDIGGALLNDHTVLVNSEDGTKRVNFDLSNVVDDRTLTIANESGTVVVRDENGDFNTANFSNALLKLNSGNSANSDSGLLIERTLTATDVDNIDDDDKLTLILNDQGTLEDNEILLSTTNDYTGVSIKFNNQIRTIVEQNDSIAIVDSDWDISPEEGDEITLFRNQHIVSYYDVKSGMWAMRTSINSNEIEEGPYIGLHVKDVVAEGEVRTDKIVAKTTDGTIDIGGVMFKNGIELSTSSTAIVDNDDETKKVNFNLSDVTTDTTRTLAIPDSNGTIVLTDATQELTNKTISLSGDLTMGEGSKIIGNVDVEGEVRTDKIVAKTNDSIIDIGSVNITNLELRRDLISSNWVDLESDVNGNIYSIAVDGNDIYVGGAFTHINNVTGTSMIAKWNSEDGWSTLDGGVDNVVYAIAVDGDDVYVGGGFSSAGGIDANNIARWNSTEGWTTLGDGVNGNIYSIAVDGSDLYVGGSFTTAGGETASRIAKWDGSTWSALQSTGFNAEVYSIAIDENHIYVGGAFSSADGVENTNSIARLNKQNNIWYALDGVLNSSSNTYINSIVIDGDDVYVGGFFTEAGSETANNIAVWNSSTEVWSTLGTGVNSVVNTVYVTDHDVYIGGNFTEIDDVTGASRIARWSKQEQSWFPLGSGLSQSAVETIAIDIKNDVYAGGAFNGVVGTSSFDGKLAKYQYTYSGDVTIEGETVINGTVVMNSTVDIAGKTTIGDDLNVSGVLKLEDKVSFVVDSTDEQEITLPDGGTLSTLDGIETLVNKTITMGGDLTMDGHNIVDPVSMNSSLKVDGTVEFGDSDYTLDVTGNHGWGNDVMDLNKIDRKLTLNSITPSWSPLGDGVNSSSDIDTDTYINSIVIDGDDVYVGGGFSSAGGIDANNIARWNSVEGWSALGDGIGGDAVISMAIDGDDLYVGGFFTTAGGEDASSIAKWNSNTEEWSALGDGTGGMVSAIATDGDGNVYVGGQITDRILKWDGNVWSTLGLGVNDSVRAIAINGNDVYVGGEFTEAGGSSANYIAKWDSSTEGWSALGDGIGSTATRPIVSIAISGDDIYVAGIFTTAGGEDASNIAKWDSNIEEWSALGDPNANSISTIAIHGDGNVYAGCRFITANGDVERIAKWDGNVWYSLDDGVNGPVRAIAVDGSDLYVGGSFTTAAGSSARRIAKYSTTNINSNISSYIVESKLSISNVTDTEMKGKVSLVQEGSNTHTDEIKAMDLVSYKIYNNVDYGVSPNELHAQGSDLVEHDGTNATSVNYKALFIKSMAAIQEMTARIDQLETDVAALQEP